jgi:predicted nucleic acid-binding protein
MRFWDSSALVALVVHEEDTPLRQRALRDDAEVLVWYGTPAEIESAIQRRRREATLPADQEVITREKLTVLSGMWQEVQATLAVRERALRLLRVHPLRAGDAFQLAAALIVCEEQTKGFYFHTSDERLAAAAAAEGFVVE